MCLLALMTIGAALISIYTGIDGSRVFLPYLLAWSSMTLLLSLLWFFMQVAALAPARVDRPMQKVIAKFRDRGANGLLLSALIFPLFLAAYTWAKCSIPSAVGYGWEHIWADSDRWLLGRDAWQIAHGWIPPEMAPAWSFFYAVIWGSVLLFAGGLIGTFASQRFCLTFFTAMMLAWFAGGFLLAYSISASGPVFAPLADPSFADRFGPLHARLVELLGKDDLVIMSQRYLADGFSADIAVKGGGISAMPSMHMATATIYVCAAWRTRWLSLASLFWLLTFVGSIYLGYHYAVDTPPAVLLAVVCWVLAKRIYGERQASLGLEFAKPLIDRNAF